MTSTKRGMGLSARELGLKAVKTRKTWPFFFEPTISEFDAPPNPFLPLFSAPKTPPINCRTVVHGQLLGVLDAGPRMGNSRGPPDAREWHFRALGCSRVAQPTPRPPAPGEAAARRHRSRSSRFKARRTLHCCAEARCAESTVPEGRRRKPGPLSVRATLVAHSPCHRSSRFTGRCSSPSGSSCTRQSPPSCPLARRCQARW